MRASLVELGNRLLALPADTLILRLTLLLLLLHGARGWHLELPLTILCGLMLMDPELARRSWIWAAVATALVWGNALQWYVIDNHKFLITYWALVCVLAVGSRDPLATLRSNARWLVGLCFLFATAWKLLPGQYLNGAFQQHTFLTDSRLETAARVVGGFTSNVLPENRMLLRTLASHPAVATTVSVESSPRLRWFTLFVSYWTILIEGSIALAFLLPRPRRHWWIRDVLLILFIATTYFLLPVIGFAFTLAILGLAQCPPGQARLRTAYLLLALLIQLTTIPWNRLVGGWI